MSSMASIACCSKNLLFNIVINMKIVHKPHKFKKEKDTSKYATQHIHIIAQKLKVMKKAQ